MVGREVRCFHLLHVLSAFRWGLPCSSVCVWQSRRKSKSAVHLTVNTTKQHQIRALAIGNRTWRDCIVCARFRRLYILRCLRSIFRQRSWLLLLLGIWCDCLCICVRVFHCLRVCASNTLKRRWWIAKLTQCRSKESSESNGNRSVRARDGQRCCFYCAFGWDRVRSTNFVSSHFVGGSVEILSFTKLLNFERFGNLTFVCWI